MRDGQIVEQGPHRDLMALAGFYAELIGHQSAGVVPAERVVTWTRENQDV